MNVQSIKRGLVVVGLLFAAVAANASIADVRVVNRSSQDVLSIHVSPTYSPYRGIQDVLGAHVIHSGYNMIIDFDVRDAQGQCLLDIEAVGSRSGRWTRRMNVCNIEQWTLYD